MLKLHASENLLIEISELISRELGIFFSKDRFKDLEQNLVGLAKELNFETLDLLIQNYLAQPMTSQRLQLLVKYMTVGETYFLRDTRSFEVLEEILPNILASKGTEKVLNIWSAGCCTGEEPYSIAILMKRLHYQLNGWKISIYGTDINEHFLDLARKGLYGEWSFRQSPPWLKDYFNKMKNGKYKINSDIQSMVNFKNLNLISPIFPSEMKNMDFIFCRNVLMYFDTNQIKSIISKFSNCLSFLSASLP
jgi:chemotaxis protein methyltransferase CheR